MVRPTNITFVQTLLACRLYLLVDVDESRESRVGVQGSGMQRHGATALKLCAWMGCGPIKGPMWEMGLHAALNRNLGFVEVELEA